VITHFTPGDNFALRMFYRAEGEQASEIQREWDNQGMLKESFGKRFITDFFFTGENLTVSNLGAMPLKPS
jgi:hypothetical protein